MSLMRPSAPPLDPAFHKGDSRRAVQSEQPEQNRRSAVQPRPAIPPPPRMPRELLPPAQEVPMRRFEFHSDTLAAPPLSEAIVPAEPSVVEIDEDPDVPDFDATPRAGAGVISREMHDKRVTELLDSGNRQLQEARDERAAHARTRFLLDCAVTQALAWKARAHRLDPAWRSP